MNIGMTILLLYVVGALLAKAFFSIPLIEDLVESEGGTETTIFIMIALWPLVLLMWLFIHFFSWTLPGDNNGQDEEDIHI